MLGDKDWPARARESIGDSSTDDREFRGTVVTAKAQVCDQHSAPSQGGDFCRRAAA
jgi:hypothetical protein